MSESERRLYLLDASNYVYRAFHSTNPRDGFAQSLSTSSGMPTNAILVFTNMIRKLLREHRPTHFAAVFDTPGARGFRYDAYPEYKANRSSMPDDLRVQFPYFRPIVEGLGLHLLEHEGVEADDVLATLAKKAVEQGWEAVMVSSDKDLYQLLGNGIRMYDGMKDRWIDLATVDKKFGVAPEKVSEVQALIGDTSDNIPGVPGVGPKTAAKLIHQYETLEGIYDNIDKIKGKLQERLRDNKEAAFTSRTLTRLLTDLEVDVQFDALEIQEPNGDVLVPIFHELEMKVLAKEYQKVAVPEREITRHTVLEQADLDALVKALDSANRFAVTILGDDRHYVTADIVGLGFVAGDDAWYVPMRHRYLGAPAQLDADHVLAALKPALEEDGKHAVHGDKEARALLSRVGITLGRPSVDTELWSYVANATKYEHSLENIALDHLELRLGDAPEDIRKGKQTWTSSMVDEACTYVLSRTEAVDRVAPVLAEEIGEGKLSSLLQDMELPLSRILAEIELRGVVVDGEVLRNLSREFGEKLTSLERRCHELADGPFNVGSPKQLAHVLFEKLELPVVKRTKTGPSTDASVLDQLADKHEIVQAVLDWRSLSKLKGTYTDVLPTLVNKRTGRIHTNFRQAVAATGRLSSFDPNLQNIPIRTEEGRRIRDAFVAPEGAVVMSADYSQIELRVLAHLSEDPGLVQAFRDKEDIHTRTAASVFDVPASEVTREQRSASKAINFGLMYGMGAFRLARDLHISRAQAQEWIDKYFERFSSVKAYMDGTIESGRKTGYVETLFGRRRYVPELRSRNFTRRSGAERAAINAPVQGTAADLIKVAMIRVFDALRAEKMETRMVLQVHDELVFDVPKDEIEAASKLVRAQMEAVYSLNVPLEVSLATGGNWNEAH